MEKLSRRDLLRTVTAGVLPFSLYGKASKEVSGPVIDIHQHTNYSGRSDDVLIAHQRTMGVTKAVLLPAGSKYGLDAGAGGNDTVVGLARRRPKQFVFFANELPDIPETRPVLEKYLKMGALGIGEQKFPVACDSEYIHLVAKIAQEFGVPVLMHFEHGKYNTGIERFHTVLEKFSKVNFIGHANAWWGNIDRNHVPTARYPKGPVTPGGITDRLLSDYTNMYGDLSAGSGLNALTRDEPFTREFLERHQDKLLWGSDCSDRIGQGPDCIGSQSLAAVRHLAPNKTVVRKILFRNAQRVIKVKL
jgi:uncharacterized protein